MADLRRFLLELPRQFDYKHQRVGAMRAELRRRLFAEATVDGRYLPMLFEDPESALSARELPPPEEWLPASADLQHYHGSRPCSRKLRLGEPTYRCLTCGLDDTCVLCNFCYNAADHEGHDVVVHITPRDEGGICDCGDPEAWNAELHCTTAELYKELLKRDPAGDNGVPTKDNIPNDFREQFQKTVSILLDYCLDVFSASHCNQQFFDSPQQVRDNFTESELDPWIYGAEDVPGDGKFMLLLWNDDKPTFHDVTIKVQLATHRTAEFGFMIAKQADSHGRALVSVTDDIEELFAQKKVLNHLTVTIRSSREYMREEMCDEIIHCLHALTNARLRREPNAEVLPHLIGETMLQPWRIGNKFLNNNQQGGPLPSAKPNFLHPSWDQATLMGSGIPPTLEPGPTSGHIVPSSFEGYETDVTVNLSHLTFTDIVQNTPDQQTMEYLFRDSFNQRKQTNDFPTIQPLSGPESKAPVYKSSIWTDEAIASDEQYQNIVAREREHGTARAKMLIFFDVRLWKSLRTTLSNLHVFALISNLDYKSQLGRLYAEIYPQLSEIYLMADREPEVSVLTALSTQLFTTPSVATEHMSSPFYARFVAAMYTIFSSQHVGGPSDISTGAELNFSVLDNRRFGQMFHDAIYLVSRNTDKINVVGQPRRLLMFADFLSLFQGIVPMKRQVQKHIEFENNAWIYLFTTLPIILQVSDAVAFGLQDFEFTQIAASVAEVAKTLLLLSREYHVRLAGRLQAVEATSFFGGVEIKRLINGYSVADNLVSLHHPVHVYLASLLQSAKVPDVATFRQLLFRGRVDGISFDEPPETALEREFIYGLLFEAPLQAMATLSQIHIGLWVRNGYSLRSQLLHYRETTLREYVFMKDVYMAQTALVVMDTNMIMLQLLERWSVRNWQESTLFDESQRFYMLEEFLHMLTYLLVDRVYLQSYGEHDLKWALYKREIIQCLSFRDMSFSEISQNVLDSMANDDFFETVLQDSTTFTPPKGIRDVGIYSLKEELRVHFDSHYTHFNSARIEEAEQVSARYHAKTTGTRIEDAVHLPPMETNPKPWSDLGAFTRSVAFARFTTDLFSSMLRESGAKNQVHAETVLAKALHLLLRAAQDDLTRDTSLSTSDKDVYTSLAAWIVADDGRGGSMIANLHAILADRELNSLHARVKRLLQLLHERSPEHVAAVASAQEVDADMTERESDKKKRRGKEMQAKILEELKMQQEAFAKNISQVDDASGLDDDLTHDDHLDDGEEEEAGWSFPKHQCVLCHLPDDENSIFGLMTYCSPARIERHVDESTPEDWLAEGYGDVSSSLDVEIPSDPGNIPGTQAWSDLWERKKLDKDRRAFPLNNTEVTPVFLTCGHGIHFSCYEEFIKHQSSRSHQLTRFNPELANKGEYLCPLCRGLNNGFMPVMWKRNKLSAEELYAAPAAPRDELDKLLAPSQEADVELEALVERGFENVLPKFTGVQTTLTFRNERDSDAARALLRQMQQVDESFGKSSDELAAVSNVFKAYARTISTTEISLRGVKHEQMGGGIIVDQLNIKQVKLLRVATQYLRTVTGIVAGIRRSSPEHMAHLGRRALSGEAEGALDPLNQLVEMLFYLGPGLGASPFTALRMAFAESVVQFLLKGQAFTADLSWIPRSGEPTDDILTHLQVFIPHQDPRVVYSMLLRQVTTFLRKAALVTYAICGDYDADNFAFMMAKPEHERLALYLGLPSIDSMIREISDSNTLAGGLALQLELRAFAPLEYPGVFRLIRLPTRLDEFFELGRSSRARVPGDPAICLFCGEMLALQHAVLKNNERGPCTRHMAECATQYGIYITPKRNSMLFLTDDSRGTFAKAPYLDMHGEPDESMRRSRPHYLQQNRYDALTRSIWLEHGLTSFTARKLDQNVDYGGWDTL